jgi:hypothetical protein
VLPYRGPNRGLTLPRGCLIVLPCSEPQPGSLVLLIPKKRAKERTYELRSEK